MTKTQLKRLVRYDPETGHFAKEVMASIKDAKPWVDLGIGRMTWYRRGYHKKFNQKTTIRADFPSGRYHNVTIGGHAYRAHRLAWLYSHGNWPSLIDHINGDGHDNRLINLREATKAQNRINYRKQNISNLTGVRGVTLLRRGSKKYYIAKIRSGGKPIFQKCCRTLIEATESLIAARKNLYGKFAPYHDAALCGLLAFFIMSSVADASICLTKKQARELWPTRHIWWFIDKETGNRCWSNRRGPPRGLKLDPIKMDPRIPNHARAEAKEELPAPKTEAPLRSDGPLQIVRDGCCWPKLSEFDLLWDKIMQTLKSAAKGIYE